MVIVIEDKCLGCGVCETACPVGAIVMKEGIAEINSDVCTNCGACVPECPVEAIELTD